MIPTTGSMAASDFLFLYNRDLEKLIQEVRQYPSEDAIWVLAPGILNSAGNLCQHIAGNLKTYIGAALGGFAYVRERDKEFSERQYNQASLVQLLAETKNIVVQTLQQLGDDGLAAAYPKDILQISEQQTVTLVLVHLLAHLTYHTGQVNYHRRLLS